MQVIYKRYIPILLQVFISFIHKNTDILNYQAFMYMRSQKSILYDLTMGTSVLVNLVLKVEEDLKEKKKLKYWCDSSKCVVKFF